MLNQLKILEDKLYLPEALAVFLEKNNVHEVIKQLNKSSKKETRDRIQYFFSKVSQSNYYKDFLYACLTEQKESKKQFLKYVSSEYSEQFFVMLQNRSDEVLHIIQNNQQIIPVLVKLVGFPYGIKLIKLFKRLYQQKSQYQCLFNPLIKTGLALGLGYEEGSNQVTQGVDTEAQMRYLEIVVNITILGGKCFNFLGDILNVGLGLYKSQDMLLKMAMVQVISVLGEGQETSKLLREHKIWKLIEKDACDPEQQFYVKKFLLILLVDMHSNGNYQLSQKVIKHLHEFLNINIRQKGEFVQAAVDIVAHLFQTAQGCRIVVQNMDLFTGYITISRTTLDSVKGPYYQSLVNLTQHGCASTKETKEHPKYKLVINILNCIGKPNLISQLNHNLHANNYLVYGIQDFCKWFCKLLLLPFQETELQLLDIFINLLNYYEIIEVLLQNQESSKYLLKPVIPNDTNKLLRTKKAGLINTIILKGSNDWEGLELSEYSRNLQKMIEGKKTESVYALDVE